MSSARPAEHVVGQWRPSRPHDGAGVGQGSASTSGQRAGSILRFVRSPDAPRITTAHGSGTRTSGSPSRSGSRRRSRSRIASRTGGLALRRARVARPVARMPSSSSSNESANFWTPSRLERRDDVVVVDARVGEIARAAAAPRRRPRSACSARPRRDPGTPRSSRPASCSPSPARSAPRRRARRGTRGSSSRSRPRGSAAAARPCAARRSQRGPEKTSW